MASTEFRCCSVRAAPPTGSMPAACGPSLAWDTQVPQRGFFRELQCTQLKVRQLQPFKQGELLCQFCCYCCCCCRLAIAAAFAAVAAVGWRLLLFLPLLLLLLSLLSADVG